MMANPTQPALLEDRVQSGGDAGHHVGEDEDGHPLADAPLGDQLGQPHHEGGAGGEGHDDEGGPPDRVVEDQVDARGSAEEPAAALVEQVDQAGGLHQGQGHGQVAGGLGQLLLADRPLVTPLLELGDDRGQQLDDDRWR